MTQTFMYRMYVCRGAKDGKEWRCTGSTYAAMPWMARSGDVQNVRYAFLPRMAKSGDETLFKFNLKNLRGSYGCQ